MQFEILSMSSFHHYFVMTIFFLQMDREWMYIINRVSQRFIEGLETFLETNTRSQKICLMFTIYVTHVLIAVMRKDSRYKGDS
jgi:hypothetical protein